jgi:hypothetical protein
MYNNKKLKLRRLIFGVLLNLISAAFCEFCAVAFDAGFWGLSVFGLMFCSASGTGVGCGTVFHSYKSPCLGFL